MSIATWFAARWAGAKIAGAAVQWSRLLPWLALLLGVLAALWAIEQHGFRRGVAHEHPIAFAAGEKGDRATWLEAQAKAAAEHKAKAKATEDRQADIGTKVGEKHAHDAADLHAAYDRVRDKARRGAASGTELPGVPGAAGVVDAATGADDVTVAAPLVLIEEGDECRLQVQAWQAWYAGVRAAAVAPK